MQGLHGMKRAATLALALAAPCSAIAMSQCPPEAHGHCGPNPFYVMLVVFAPPCSAAFPEQAPVFKERLAAMVAEDPEAYADVESNAEFQEMRAEGLKKIPTLSREELKEACAVLASPDSPPGQ